MGEGEKKQDVREEQGDLEEGERGEIRESRTRGEENEIK